MAQMKADIIQMKNLTLMCEPMWPFYGCTLSHLYHFRVMQKIVVTYTEELMPLAIEMINHLVETFAKVSICREELPGHTRQFFNMPHFVILNSICF